jgi:hypothetical protein
VLQLVDVHDEAAEEIRRGRLAAGASRGTVLLVAVRRPTAVPREHAARPPGTSICTSI